MTAIATRPHSEAAQPLMTHRQILFVVYGLMAGMFLSSLDQTIVGTAIRTIGEAAVSASIRRPAFVSEGLGGSGFRSGDFGGWAWEGCRWAVRAWS